MFFKVVSILVDKIKILLGFDKGTKFKSETVRNEGFFELVINQDVIKQLSDKFSSSPLTLQEFQLVIGVPVSLGRELWMACRKSTFKQQDQTLCKFKVVEEDDDGDDDHITDRQLEVDGFGAVNSYRETSHYHMKQQRINYKNAKKCLKANNKVQAQHFYNAANKHLQIARKADEDAAEYLRSICRKQNGILDLHGFKSDEAIDVLDQFLDDNILQLEEELLDMKKVTVITGRGKHSQAGVPVIKQKVSKRLQERGLRYFQINPGCLGVNIKMCSLLSTELRDDYSDSDF